MSDERDSLVGGDCDHDDLLELRSYNRSTRKAVLRVCRQRGCVSSSPKASMSSTVLPPEKRNPPPNLQRCNFSAKSCLRPPSVHSVSLCLLGSRNDMSCSMVWKVDRAGAAWRLGGHSITRTMLMRCPRRRQAQLSASFRSSTGPRLSSPPVRQSRTSSGICGAAANGACRSSPAHLSSPPD